jgi:hypothetical protein
MLPQSDVLPILPAVNPHEHNAGNVEADTARDDRISRRQIQRARRVLLAVSNLED